MQLPTRQSEAVRQEVYVNEMIEWTGRPRPLYTAQRGLWGCAYGTIVLGLAAITYGAATRWQLPSLSSGQGWMILLTCVVALLAGLVLLAAPLWLGWSALRTIYVITDKRAIILRTGWRGRTLSFEPDRLQYRIVLPEADGSGNILFEPPSLYGRDGAVHLMATGFLGIDAVGRVDRLLTALAGLREYHPSPASRRDRKGLWTAAIFLLLWTTGFTAGLLNQGQERELTILRTRAGRVDAIARNSWTGIVGLRTQTMPGIRAASRVYYPWADENSTYEFLRLETSSGPVELDPGDCDAGALAASINGFLVDANAPPLVLRQRNFGGIVVVPVMAFTMLGAGLALLFLWMAWNSRRLPI